MALLAEPVIGYRAWTVMGSALRMELVSAFAHVHDGDPLHPRFFPWCPGVTVAPNFGEPIGSGERVRGGLHAFHTPRHLRIQGPSPGFTYYRQIVHGAAVFGGRIAVTPRGLRAERAVPVALLATPGFGLGALAHRYGVKVCRTKQELVEEASRWGRAYDPSTLGDDVPSLFSA